MEKKFYEKPVMQVERFVPNQYVSACLQPDTWVATCDKFSSLIFYGNPSGPFDLKCDLNRGGCGQSHTFTLTDGKKPEASCWILQGVSGKTPYSNDNLSENSYYFTDASWQAYRSSGSVTSLVLKDEYKGELIAAYVNQEVLDGVLLTSDIKNIKNPS
jgi:hypothetical protein